MARRNKPKRKGKGKKGKPATRRVLIQPPRVAAHAGQEAAWLNDYERGLASQVKVHPIVRLTETGPDYGTQPGPGDEIGYGMDPYRHDDCFSAAIATATQHPIEQVPDLRVDERASAGEDLVDLNRSSWERIERWAEGVGSRLVVHEQVPADRDRWIGVCPAPEDARVTGDHCLVMAGDRLVFDPVISVACPPGETTAHFSPADIAYGISFDREE